MKKLLMALVILSLNGCRMTPSGGLILSGGKQRVDRYHDDSLKVSCWVTVSGSGDGIWCIPDAALKVVP